jgi:hypothetical protein
MNDKTRKKYHSTAKHGKRHGEATKLAVIAQLGAGMTIREAAKANGMSTATVLRFKEEMGSVDTISHEVNTIKKGLSRKVWNIADLLANSVIDNPEVIDNASLSQRMVGMGISIEKGQLLEGQPTAINQYTEMSDQDLERSLKDKLKSANKLGIRITEVVAGVSRDRE